MGGGPEGKPEDEPATPEREDGGAPAAKDADDAIDASLHVALSDLERMLDSREDPTARRGAAPGAEPEGDEDQYTIPLLHEVAIPGPAQAVPPAPSREREPEPEPLADDEPSVRARIAARIASEVDVIVQDRIEQALEPVREEIRKRVRDHIDMVLPEIVEELVQARKRHDRP